MPEIIAHAAAGVALAQILASCDRAPCDRRRELSWLAAGCAMLPDADVVSFTFGVRYGEMLGHRGLTHSIAFAAATALCVWLWRRDARYFLCAFLATISHGILDAFTNGGLGVAFFAPFSADRYFFPWTPIEVSPIGFGFFSARGASVLANEMVWVGVPSALLIVAARLTRCR